MVLSIRKAEKRDLEELCRLMEELSGDTVAEEQMLDRLELIEVSNIDSLYVCEVI